MKAGGAAPAPPLSLTMVHYHCLQESYFCLLTKIKSIKRKMQNAEERDFS